MTDINDQYTDEESAFARAFAQSEACCSTQCECGRVFFVSARGHGDYEEGELEQLQESAKFNPEKFVESSEFDTIDIPYINGQCRIVQCPCGVARQWIAIFEKHADQLVTYLHERLKNRQKSAQRELDELNKSVATIRHVMDAEQAEESTDWQIAAVIPKSSADIELAFTGEYPMQIGHYASNLSGEEQPPFKGYFVSVKDDTGKTLYHRQVTPVAWRPITTH